jgi:hypothetical protein
MADASEIAQEITALLCKNDGLTEKQLSICPALLHSLGTIDLTEAMRQFVAAIDALPDDERAAALKNALRLDPTAPAHLSGVNGRRAAFARINGVREQAVWEWEQYAIDALAGSLASLPNGHIEEIGIIFHVEGKQILFKSETRIWTDGPAKPGNPVSNTNMRIETRNIPNKAGMHMQCGVYQLRTGEHPTALDVYAIFPDNQLPDVAFSVNAADVFALTTGDYERIDLGRPHPAVSILSDEDIDPDLDNMSGYVKRFKQPHHGGIYGIAWIYG